MTVLAENLQTMTGVNWRREVRFYVPMVEGGYAAAGAIATAVVTVVPDVNGIIVAPNLPSGRGQVRIDGHAYDFVIPTVTVGNDVQMVIMSDVPTTLTYKGQTTTDIAVDATAEMIQAALEALPNIGINHVAVLGDPGGPFTVLFKLPTGITVPFDLPAAFTGLGGDIAQLTASTAQVGTKLAVLLGLALEYPPPVVLEAQEYAMAAAASAAVGPSPRVLSLASSPTPIVNTDIYDVVVITGLTVDITSMSTNLSGSPLTEQPLRFVIQGTATRNILWGPKFENGAVVLPPATIGTQRLDVGFTYNYAASKWRCIFMGSA